MADYQEGQTATNPKTGQKVVYRGGQWVNLQAPDGTARLKPVEMKSLEEARGSANNSYEVLNDLTRFQNLNAQEGSGGFGGLPGIRNIRQAFDPEAQQMAEITARLAPAQRQAGSGTTSDRDLALYLQAVPGINRSPTANTAIIERGRGEAVRRQQYADFLDQYASQNGTLAGAQQAFRSQVGLGTRQSPYSGSSADPATLPRGAYYRDPQGNLRRNDNGPRGNPIVEAAANQTKTKPIKQQSNVDLWAIARGGQ